MNRNRSAPLVVWVVTLLVCAVALWLQAKPLEEEVAAWGFRGLHGVMSVAFATVGYLIRRARPGNEVGWIFVVVGFATGLQYLVDQYTFAATAADHVPYVPFVAWVHMWIWIPLIALIGYLFLVFPGGDLELRAERVVRAALAITGGAALLSWAFLPPEMEALPGIANPYGLLEDQEVATAIVGLTISLLMGAILVSAGFLVARFRRSRGVLRQQLKWFVTAALLGSLLLMLNFFFQAALLVASSAAVAIIALPVAAGVAILRHRLFDIDVIINRALVYALVTSTLGAIYLVLVVVLQALLQPLTADSDIAVAASTLAVAALFRPARNRIQVFIDRRFYRRKYDGSATLQHFSYRLRDEVDLDSLRSDFLGVVGSTMQPSHASLWLPRTGDPT